ncbi:aspartate/glutamate racemase family protein [Acidobacteriota bacterium]
MKTIGLIGGMTCESSCEYYRLINEITRSKLGGIHSASSVMISVDFAVIESLMEAGKWDEILDILVECAHNVEKAGADFLVLCTNTMHKLADDIQIHTEIPILNIIDAAADQIIDREFNTIGLLGTRFTMEEDFYKDRLKEEHGLEVLIPSPGEIETIHRVIVKELSIGKIRESSKKLYWQIINRLADRGAQGILLGCTEIPLLVHEKEGNIPLFDTTLIHATAAVEYALNS